MDDRLNNRLREVVTHFDAALIEALAMLLESGEPEWISTESLSLGAAWMATRLIDGPDFVLTNDDSPVGLSWLEREIGLRVVQRQRLRREWFDDPRMVTARALLLHVAELVILTDSQADMPECKSGELASLSGRVGYRIMRDDHPEAHEDWMGALKFYDDWVASEETEEEPA